MKKAAEWRKQWAFGKCPHGAPFPRPSIECGLCLEEVIAAAQREAAAEAEATAAALRMLVQEAEPRCIQHPQTEVARCPGCSASARARAVRTAALAGTAGAAILARLDRYAAETGMSAGLLGQLEVRRDAVIAALREHAAKLPPPVIVHTHEQLGVIAYWIGRGRLQQYTPEEETVVSTLLEMIRPVEVLEVTTGWVHGPGAKA